MEQAEIPLSDKEFARIQARVLKIAGISLGSSKRTLVISRLSKILRRLDIPSFDAYVDHLDRQGGDHDLQQEFVNALTTNLTRFYREDHHFDHLRTYVGDLIKAQSAGKRDKRLRIWSAGCSTGQEPYTIAMDLLHTYPELARWDFKILATDIDTNVLAKAATGVYPEGDLSGLSAARTALFEKGDPGFARVPAAARNLIAFKPLNIHEAWPMRGPFDAIFCRNVAIYFEKPVQMQMFTRMGDLLARGAFLYIGHSESIAGGAGKFSLVGKTIYRLSAEAKPGVAA